MKIQTATSQVRDDTALESRRASIELNPVIAHVLSRDLYQRPAEAALREILINAIDAHTEAVVSRPVTVHLPSAWDEVFSIRDYGHGMSHEDVMDIYLSYGTSTRRGTNDVHGGLGLGTKSPLAYTDAFTVISRHDTTKSEYLIYYDADGIPAVTLRKQEPLAWGDSTGLTVQFTMKESSDYRRFAEAAQNVLPYIPAGLYELNFEDTSLSVATCQPASYISYGPLRLSSGSGIEVIMGYVRYSVDATQVSQLLHATDLHTTVGGTQIAIAKAVDKMLARNQLTIVADIGDYQVHPSRESIVLTKRTARRLADSVASGLKAMFAGLDTPDLTRDVAMYNATGLLPEHLGLLQIRARIVTAAPYWSYNNAGIITTQLLKYSELIEVLFREKPDMSTVLVATLSSQDFTDYLGKGRSSYEYPSSLHKKKTLFFFDHDATDNSILKALRAFPPAVLGDDVDRYRRDQEYNNNSRYTRSWTPRAPVKSMQDPAHNVLVLDLQKCNNTSPSYTQAFREYRHGGMKKHWNSAEHNVSSLKLLNRPIFWVPTKMGCITDPDQNHELIDALQALGNMIPAKNMPIIIGLPATKGTKKLEAVFRPIIELKNWLEDYCETPWARRRLSFAKTKVTLHHVRMPELNKLTIHGDVSYLHRVLTIGEKYTTPLSKYFITFEDLARLEKLVPIKPHPIKSLWRRVLAMFPYVSSEVSQWYSIPAQVENLTIEWARELADLTNKHPTGAMYK